MRKFLILCDCRQVILMDRHPPGPLDALWWAVAAGQGPAALHHMPNTTQPGALLVILDVSLYWHVLDLYLAGSWVLLLLVGCALR